MLQLLSEGKWESCSVGWWLWGTVGGWGAGVGGCKMYAVCRVNLFHMTGLGLFLSTALLSSKESGSVTT